MKKLASFLIIVAILGALAATNPGKDRFVDWTQNRLSGGSDQPLKRLGAAVAAPVVGAVTSVNNYVFCSVFKTDTPSGPSYTLGIMGGFIKLK